MNKRLCRKHLHEVFHSDPRWLSLEGYFKIFVQRIALFWMLEPYWNNRVEIVAKGEYKVHCFILHVCFIVVLLDLFSIGRET